jgi:hypothetical protein
MNATKCLSLGVIVAAALSAQQPDATTATTPTAPTGVARLQRRVVSPENLYHHIITVVPFTGKGTYNDPKRPMYLPSTHASATSRAGILGYTFVPSDDGKSAIVEFAAADMGAFTPIYADASLKIFQKGKDHKATIEAFMQKYRKGFTLDKFGVTVR